MTTDIAAELGHQDAGLNTRAKSAASVGLNRTFAALADPCRRLIVELLRERPRRAGELAAAAGIKPPALSRHLRTLRHAGWVEDRHDRIDERVRIYQLRSEPIAELASWLQDTNAMWASQRTT